MTTGFTYALGVCTAGVECAAPAPGDGAPASVTPTVVPTSAECSTFAPDATLEANGVGFRFVNATSKPLFVSSVASAADGCTVSPWTDVRAGKSARGTSILGLVWLFADGASAAASSTWVQSTEPTLWVIQ